MHDSKATQAPCGSSDIARWIMCAESGAGMSSSPTSEMVRLLDAGGLPGCEASASASLRTHLSTDDSDGREVPPSAIAAPVPCICTDQQEGEGLYLSEAGRIGVANSLYYCT